MLLLGLEDFAHGLGLGLGPLPELLQGIGGVLLAAALQVGQQLLNVARAQAWSCFCTVSVMACPDFSSNASSRRWSVFDSASRA